MSMRMRLLVILAILGSACSQNAPAGNAAAAAKPDPAAVKAAIEASNAKFLEAFKHADKAALVANYASDAVVMMPNEEAWRGHDELDKGFGGFLEQMSFKEGGAATTDVMVDGDMAVETGTFAWTLQPKTGAEVKDKGKYLTVWKHQSDGSWKIVRDINNSDLPAGK